MSQMYDTAKDSRRDTHEQPAAIVPVGENILIAAGAFDEAVPFTEVRLPNGEIRHLPTALLTSQLSSPSFSAAPASAPDTFLAAPVEHGDTTIIPLAEERLDVTRHTVSTGTVRLNKTVKEYHHTLDEPLAVRTFDIERLVLNQPIDAVPVVRQEGSTTIYPVIEEQLILTKQLILKEEIRVTQRDTERRDTQTVTLRREHLAVEREPVL